jgi:hypothetical protein
MTAQVKNIEEIKEGDYLEYLFGYNTNNRVVKSINIEKDTITFIGRYYNGQYIWNGEVTISFISKKIKNGEIRKHNHTPKK